MHNPCSEFLGSKKTSRKDHYNLNIGSPLNFHISFPRILVLLNNRLSNNTKMNRIADMLLPIDEETGFKIITGDLLNTLNVLPEDSVPNTSPYHVLYKDIKIPIFNDFDITKFSKQSCDISNGVIPEDYSPPRLDVLGACVIPPNFRALKEVLESACNLDNTYSPLKLKGKYMGLIVSCFSIYPEFGPVYNAYVKRPDVGITTGSLADLDVENIPGKATLEDIKATVHLLILLMSKSFPNTSAQTQEHVRNYLENRLKAIKNVMRLDECKFIVDKDTLTSMLNTWNMFPKLKLAIFDMLMYCRHYTEISTALLLIADASMISLQCIDKFLLCQVTTTAHAYTEVLEEACKYTLQLQEMKDKYKKLWVFYRTIAPEDTTLASSKFPNLFTAAIIYCKTFINTTESFKRITETQHAVAPNLRQAATEKLAEGMLLPNQAGMATDTPEARKLMARKFGIDINKWVMPTRLRGPLLADQPDNNNRIERLLEMMMQNNLNNQGQQPQQN